MSQTIIVVPWGGLGNQLFQLAAGLATATTLGGQLWLAPPEENKHSQRDYRISLFSKLAKAIGPDGSPIVTQDLLTPYFQQNGFEAWSPSRWRGHPVLFLKGYFQYYPAIQHEISFIRSAFLNTLAPLRNAVAKTYHITSPARTAFLHVRRGDYAANGWILDTNGYVVQAVPAIQRAAGTPLNRWLVLSDDPSWCASQLRWPLDTSPPEIIDQPDELITILLMSLCQGGAAVANSTFSWWGAQLGAGAAGAPVVYPSQWVAGKEPDLFPSSWRRMSL